MAISSPLLASPSDEAAHSAEEAELQATLEAEYKQALAAADKSQAEAEASMEKAREQFELAKEQQHRETNRAAIAAMREELGRAQHELRKSSREISRINRDLARAKLAGDAPSFVFSTGDRPVLGVILGDGNDVGIKVLGVSPDGPAERAGVKAGDVIVSLGGHALAVVDETDNTRSGLNFALQDIKADEPVVVAVKRGSETLDLTVVPEIREPLTWQSVVRFPSTSTAPALAGDTIMIERIVVPEIDTQGLADQIATMRIEIDERRALMKSGATAPLPELHHYEFQFGEMSEMGNFALHDTNAWFGMPLASGLRLAAIEPGLGEYFKTDRGVLVLKAKDDNDLLLQAGDVILSVHGTEVNSPADFMRTLREFEPGDELVIDIKRKRKSKTLKPVIDDSHTRFFAPEDGGLHKITVTTDSD